MKKTNLFRTIIIALSFGLMISMCACGNTGTGAESSEASSKVELTAEQQVEKLTRVVENSKLRMKYDEDFNYLQVLLARQSLLEARLALLGNRFMLLGSTIQLYKSLGGGN